MHYILILNYLMKYFVFYLQYYAYLKKMLIITIIIISYFFDQF